MLKPHIFLVLPQTVAQKKAFYSFLFTSLIIPTSISNFRFFFEKIKFLEKKAWLKQSYVLLTWFFYITTFTPKKQKRKQGLSLFVLPITRNVITLGRAPIAHKNWSKEQFFFQYFLIRVSFRLEFLSDNVIYDVDQALLFFMLAQKSFPLFETNLLYLKSFRYRIGFQGSDYFKYEIKKF